MKSKINKLTPDVIKQIIKEEKQKLLEEKIQSNPKFKKLFEALRLLSIINKKEKQLRESKLAVKKIIAKERRK